MPGANLSLLNDDPVGPTVPTPPTAGSQPSRWRITVRGASRWMEQPRAAALLLNKPKSVAAYAAAKQSRRVIITAGAVRLGGCLTNRCPFHSCRILVFNQSSYNSHT